MTERFPFGPSHTARPPPFSLVNSASFGSARSSPELNYSTAPGVLILHPSTPAIAPLNQGQLTS